MKNFQGRGVGWYRDQFRRWDGAPVVGEATPGYMLWRHHPKRVAQRIQEILPDVRLIALLRNPIDRAYSAMLHHIRRGRLPHSSSLLEVVRREPPEEERLNLVTGGWYAASLRPFRALFGDQLLVLLHDDVRENPHRVYQRALLHIGARDDFVPPDLDQIVFSNIDRMRSPVAPLSEEDRLAVWDFFRDDVAKLEWMFDLDLSRWKPAGAEWGEARTERVFLLAHEWERATSWVGEVIGGVAPDQLDLAMRFRDVTVGEAIASMVRNGNTLLTILRPGEPPETDGLDGERARDEAVASYRATVRAIHQIVAGWAPGTDAPGVALTLLGHVAAAWEIALVTGQDATIPSELAAITERPARDVMANRSQVSESLKAFITRNQVGA